MTYVIAEIGQNHQGSVEVAKDLIRMASDPRPHDLHDAPHFSASAVKLTRRDLAHEMAEPYWSEPYTGDNAFAPTYSEHRTVLELTDEEHAACYTYAKSLGLDFVETVCNPGALSILDHFTPDYLKVASRDLTNSRLLRAIADTGLPVILSTGMADRDDLDAALGIVRTGTTNITVLHCLSEYPATAGNLNLSRIPHLRALYPHVRIGYSDHAVGTSAATVAAALGAEVIEEHVTLDRTMRGSDHRGSLERDGLWRLLRDLNEMDEAMGSPDIERVAAADSAAHKLERSVAASTDLPAGHVLTLADLEPLSPGTGIPWADVAQIVGARLTAPARARHLIQSECLAFMAASS